MDKEFSLGAVLLWGLIGGALMFFAARLKPLRLLVVAPTIGLFFFGQLSELTDLHVGPAIKIEAGQFYIFSSPGSCQFRLSSAAVFATF